MTGAKKQFFDLTTCQLLLFEIKNQKIIILSIRSKLIMSLKTRPFHDQFLKKAGYPVRWNQRGRSPIAGRAQANGLAGKKANEWPGGAKCRPGSTTISAHRVPIISGVQGAQPEKKKGPKVVLEASPNYKRPKRQRSSPTARF